MSKVMVFDLDDTLYATRAFLVKMLKEVYGFELPGYDGYITPEITNGKSDRIIREGTFMSHVRLFPELAKDRKLHSLFDLLRSNGWKVVNCTHRGYHSKARVYSQAAFRRDGIRFDEEFYLDSSKAPCKLDFLNEQYGEFGYLLLDDNPSHSDKNLVGKSVMLIDRPWNQDYTVCPTRRIRSENMISRIERHVLLDNDRSKP